MALLTRILIASAIFFLTATAQGQGSDDATDFALPADEVGDQIGDGGLDLDDADFTGNPANSLFGWWPEDLVVAPIPGYSPQLGWSLTLAAAYFVTEREVDGPPPSMLGGFGFASDNGSYMLGLGGRFHLRDDRLRLKAGVGYMDLRYRYYGSGLLENDLGISLDILQTGPVYFASASARTWRRLYLGAGFLGGSIDASPRLNREDTGFFDPVLGVNLGGLLLPIEWDSRDHEQFPRRGTFVKGRGVVYREELGSDFDGEIFQLAYNRYLPVRDTDVLAVRASFRTAEGDVPFFLLSTFGGDTDLRGYPSGRYRDRMMYALQGEYRWQFRERWILTGFAGFGEVAARFGNFGEDLLPAAGAGIRFVLSPKHRMSLSADVAVGKHGAEFYVGVGEAF